MQRIQHLEWEESKKKKEGRTSSRSRKYTYTHTGTYEPRIHSMPRLPLSIFHIQKPASPASQLVGRTSPLRFGSRISSSRGCSYSYSYIHDIFVVLVPACGSLWLTHSLTHVQPQPHINQRQPHNSTPQLHEPNKKKTENKKTGKETKRQETNKQKEKWHLDRCPSLPPCTSLQDTRCPVSDSVYVPTTEPL